jgi:hypothetical protein
MPAFQFNATGVRVALALGAAVLIVALSASSASAHNGVVTQVSGSGMNTIYTNQDHVTFSFSAEVDANMQTVDFLCEVNHGGEESCDETEWPTCVPSTPGMQTCSQSKTITGLTEGWYQFRVRETQCLYVVDDCDGSDFTYGALAVGAVVVDTTPPVLNITSGPSMTEPAIDSGDVFNWATPGSLTKTTCNFDALPPVPCSYHLKLDPTLKNGLHTFTVRAVDNFGNEAVSSRQFLIAKFIHKVCPKYNKHASKRERAKRARCFKIDRANRAKWEKKYLVGEP